VTDLDAVPARIQAVTLDDIKRVANEFLKPQNSVTGTLTLPAAAPAPTPTASKQ
jgi:predicted Zn-dependent peptidase